MHARGHVVSTPSEIMDVVLPPMWVSSQEYHHPKPRAGGAREEQARDGGRGGGGRGPEGRSPMMAAM